MNSKEESRNILGMYDFHHSIDIFGQFFPFLDSKLTGTTIRMSVVVPISVMCTIIPTYLIIKLILVH